jgi:hypothetical protein
MKEITTLKLRLETKHRLEKLKEHKRETFDQVLRKMLGILNTTRADPQKAQSILKNIDKNHAKMLAKERQEKKE